MTTQQIGVVAIGRNEGQRMVRCLQSVLRDVPPGRVVYVDSGSTDGSPRSAADLGVRVEALDLSVPFTAARARNAGMRRLLADQPSTLLIQFLDADCELVAGWLDAAVIVLAGNPRLAGVAGRRRERFPDATPYNRLCDLEWDTPVGEAHAVGGDALLRVEALQQVGGYDETLIAGEEPEMCVRLRDAGWTLRRLDHEMTLHDAAMDRVGQWWKRARRFGHAQLEVSRLHRGSPNRIWHRQTRSTLAWAVGPVVVSVLLVAALRLAGGWWWTWGLVPLLAYPLLVLKVSRSRRRRGDPPDHALLYALNVVAAKFPQLLGQIDFWRHRMAGRRATLIEYKGPSGA